MNRIGHVPAAVVVLGAMPAGHDVARVVDAGVMAASVSGIAVVRRDRCLRDPSQPERRRGDRRLGCGCSHSRGVPRYGHGRPRARRGGRAWPLRAVFSARPWRGRAARRGGDRLPQRGLPSARARVPRERRGRRARRAQRHDVASLLPRAAAGERLVVYGHYATLAHGHKNWRGWLAWYAASASVALWGLLSPRRRVFASRIQKLREGHQVLPMGSRRSLPVGGGPRHPAWFGEDFRALLELL